MSFLNKLILIVISFILLISLVFNFILYRGLNISIDKSITNHQEQYQQQYQGQMSINQFYVNGDSIEWKLIVCNEALICKELNKLHPLSSYYSKIYMIKEQAYIYYPEIFTKVKDNKK